jgi:hypothetical protein
MTDLVARYLPTLEGALREGLDVPSARPAEQQRLALLVVHAAVVRRTSWAEEVVRPMPGIDHGEPPPPEDFELRHQVRVDARLGELRCEACKETPGFRRCRICGGKGMVGNISCSCDEGRVRCPTCEGTGQSPRVRLRYYTDTPGLLREAYMPSQIGFVPSLFRLESTMESDIDFMREMPEELRCHDLTGRVSGTAYRGGERRVRPDFCGHEFGDAIEKALAGLSAFAAGAIRYDIRAYAWPFLWLRYPDGDVAVYRTRGGTLRAFSESAS